MLRKYALLVSWAFSLGLVLSFQGDLIGQEIGQEIGQKAAKGIRESDDELELSTKQAIEFLTKKVKNGKMDFRFKTPDREGGHQFESGSRIPPTIAPGELFEVTGEFKVTGNWEGIGDLKEHRIRMEIPIQGIPVFNVRDELALTRIREEEGIDWESWGFDHSDTSRKTEMKNGPRPKSKTQPKSKTKPRPDGERNLVLEFELSSKNGIIQYVGEFAFRWKSTEHQWVPGTYYKIIAAPTNGLCVTTRAGVFSGSIEYVPPAKKLSKIAYYVLGFLGYEPDSFYWLR